MSGTHLFDDLPIAVTIDRQIEGVDREIRFRRRVYADRVAARKMSQSKADEEIAVMLAVLRTLRRVKAGDVKGKA